MDCTAAQLAAQRMRRVLGCSWWSPGSELRARGLGRARPDRGHHGNLGEAKAVQRLKRHKPPNIGCHFHELKKRLGKETQKTGLGTPNAFSTIS